MKITLASAPVKNNNLKRTEKFIDLFHRVSIGWKEYTKTDGHYCEGKHFNAFEYEEKKVCGGSLRRPLDVRKTVGNEGCWSRCCSLAGLV